MPRKSHSLPFVQPKLTPTGRHIVVIDFLDANNMPRVETFVVVDEIAGKARLRKIMQDGLELMESGMICLYPPHRIMKVSVGEELHAS